MTRPRAIERGREVLAKANKPGPRPAEWLRAAAGPTTAQIYIYGPIDSWGGDWGVSAAEFATTLAEVTADELELHLNSPGGDYFEGVAIHNLLMQHPAQVKVLVDGMAASAASVVAMAGDRLVMGAGGQLMVHDASSICIGNPQEMRAAAEFLDALSQDAAGFYARRAGGTQAGWREVMQRETWFNSDEALAARLADESASKPPATKDDDELMSPAAHWVAAWQYQGRAGAPAPQGPAPRTDPVSTPPAPAPAAAAFDPEVLRSALKRGGGK